MRSKISSQAVIEKDAASEKVREDFEPVLLEGLDTEKGDPKAVISYVVLVVHSQCL